MPQTNDGNLLGHHRHRLADCDLGRAQTQGPAAAAMTVIVDDQRIADHFGIEPAAERAEWTDAAI